MKKIKEKLKIIAIIFYFIAVIAAIIFGLVKLADYINTIDKNTAKWDRITKKYEEILDTYKWIDKIKNNPIKMEKSHGNSIN